LQETFILNNAYRLNHDKEVWGDPEAFRPERFLDENMTIIKDSNNKLLSFGAGNSILAASCDSIENVRYIGTNMEFLLRLQNKTIC
jgi:hypothetical protein